jgi:hypothetical protein
MHSKFIELEYFRKNPVVPWLERQMNIQKAMDIDILKHDFESVINIVPRCWWDVIIKCAQG